MFLFFVVVFFFFFFFFFFVVVVVFVFFLFCLFVFVCVGGGGGGGRVGVQPETEQHIVKFVWPYLCNLHQIKKIEKKIKGRISFHFLGLRL